MIVSKRIEQTITCSKSAHQNQEIYLIVGEMSKIYKERYLCQQCMTRYRVVKSIMLCSKIEKIIQDLQNQFLERISIIVFKNIIQIIQLQQYLQDRGEKQTLKDNYEELFEKWQAELRKIAALNSFYSFRQTVENFCYYFQLLRDLKQGIQNFYQKKYENQIKAINECNFFYFQKLSYQFDCLVPIENENKICQQPDSQFLVHVYVYKDYGETYENYDQNEEQELIYCSQQDTTLPILPLCIQGNDSKNNVEKIENEEALIALLTRKTNNYYTKSFAAISNIKFLDNYLHIKTYIFSLMNQTFQPDIVVITEQLTKTLNEKKKTLNDFLKAISQVAEVEEAYSKGIEKIGNELSRIVEFSLKDSFTDIIQYIRNYLCIASEQSKTFVLQLQRDVISELQESVHNDQGWFSQVDVFQKKHSNEIKRNIEQLNQLQEEYVQALYEEIRFQKSKQQPKKYNYVQSEIKLQNFILYYNQYLDTYFQDIAQIQDIFYNVELDRRKYVQDAGMKFFMFQISVIRNLQYDVSSITQKIEQYNGASKSNEFLILHSDDKPLLSKLNVENFIQILQQQLNFNDLCLIKNRQSSNSSQDKKVDFIQANQQSYNNIFTQALKYSNMNNEIIKQLTQMIQKTKPQQYYDSFIQIIQKISNDPSDDQIDCAVTPTTYVTCLHISNILLDYCDQNYSNANLVISLYKLSKSIYKLLSVTYDDNELNEIKLTLFEGLLSHRILKNAKLWNEHAQSIETLELMQEINCDKDIIQMVKKKLKS